MAASLPSFARDVLFVCALILPLAAFSAAYDYEGKKKRFINRLSFGVGVITVIVVGILIAIYTT